MANEHRFFLMPKGSEQLLYPRSYSYPSLELARKGADSLASQYTEGLFILRVIELRYTDIQITNKHIDLTQE